MTNAEKFENVFGYKPNKSLCYAPGDVECPPDCDDCPYISWLNDEYVESKQGEQESCEDAISRQAVLDGLASIAKAKAKSDAQKSLMGRVMFFTEHLPPVQPKPKTGYISIDNVMSVFDDFMCGEVDEDGVDTFLEMLKDKAESEES